MVRFTPEEWELIDSLFALWTTEDVNEELPVAGPQRRLERSLAISRRHWTKPSPKYIIISHDSRRRDQPSSVRVGISKVLDPLFMTILNPIAPTVSTSAGECENKEQQLLEEMEKELSTPSSADSTLIPASLVDEDWLADAAHEEYTSDPEIRLYQDLAVSTPAYSTSFNPRKHQLCQHPASNSIGPD